MLLLFIGESLGMQELILIGVIALIIFGPRKLPQIAKTIGKTMAEFRKATNDFKNTWEKEVDFESFTVDDSPKPIASTGNTIAQTPNIELPAVKTVDENAMANLKNAAAAAGATPGDDGASTEDEPETDGGKRDWL